MPVLQVTAGPRSEGGLTASVMIAWCSLPFHDHAGPAVAVSECGDTSVGGCRSSIGYRPKNAADEVCGGAGLSFMWNTCYKSAYGSLEFEMCDLITNVTLLFRSATSVAPMPSFVAKVSMHLSQIDPELL